MKLKELLKDLDYLSAENPNGEVGIKGITCHSRLVQEDYLFVAIKGGNYDGHNFIREALERGAKAIIVSKKHSATFRNLDVAEEVPFIRVADTRKALAKLSACFSGYPCRHIKIVGITGTNGKTTVSYLVDKILTSSGFDVGLIGTINYKIGDRLIPSSNTTPSPENLYPFFREMVNKGIEYAVLEVSSHSLDQHRTEGIDFDIGVFTNLSGDHLDYHRTKSNYFRSKAKMFKNLNRDSFAVINNDDHYASDLRKITQARVMSYGLREGAEIKADNISLGPEGLIFSCLSPQGRIDINSHLFGRHNVYNILAAIGTALCLNIDLENIRKGIENLFSLPGRLESVDCGQPFKVFVDYAHTDDALKNVLNTLREFAPRKIFLVFGCGGERDRNKRARMGKVATALSDFTILTNDNPRSEDPQQIIKDICRGIRVKNCSVISDRYEAIKNVLLKAERDDIVLVAGKGHENYQILKTGVVPFSDREVIQCLLSSRF